MTESSQISPVDHIAHSTQELEKRARELTAADVILDEKEVIAKSFETADASVRAVLVKKHGAGGAVRVTGPGTFREVPNVVTGPDQSGFDIVLVKDGQTCMFLGNPTVRFFRLRAA